MGLTLLTDINVKLNRDSLINKLRITENMKAIEEFIPLVDEAETIAKPKGLFRKVSIDETGEDYVILNGCKFLSKILSINLKPVDTAFPGLATCGQELETWSETKTDLLQSYWVETIKEQILSEATAAVQKTIEETCDTGSTSLMIPGALDDWPISEVEKLFSLFDNNYQEIGVLLLETFMMRPLNSLSFLAFTSDEAFLGCQLCERKHCHNRRSPFDDQLYQRRYQKPAPMNSLAGNTDNFSSNSSPCTEKS